MNKYLLGLVYFFLLLVICSIIGFYLTGGYGLVRLYTNYLSQDILDKKFGVQNFIDRGPREKLSGYYAGSWGDAIYMWTFSGLKRFVSLHGTSVYEYMDTCAIVKELDELRSGKLHISYENGIVGPVHYPTVGFDFNQWSMQVKRGDYISVIRLESGRENVIDKVYASSNQYYPLEQIRTEQCQD